MNKIKLFVWGDAVTPTGFSRVLHSIVDHLPKDKYEISWLAINYGGDPHKYPYDIYPAMNGGDVYGFNRLDELLKRIKPDLIFTLNDAWVADVFVGKIYDIYNNKDIPKIVSYTPVDAEDHNPEWYRNLAKGLIVAYTKFGKKVIDKALLEIPHDREVKVITHGVDTNLFYKYDEDKALIKSRLYPDKDDFLDSFVVLNGNRNQPRKRLDITMKAFALFAKGKPDNVKLLMHCGVTDSHINVVLLAKRLGIEQRLILTSLNSGVRTVTNKKLNLIYNSADVGVNTSLGEGFGLVSIEHAVTGAPQIVPNHSACTEIYRDCGLLVPKAMPYTLDNINTTGYLVKARDVANKLEELYTSPKLYADLSKKSLDKFTSPDYSWDNISQQWDKLFDEELSE